MHKFFYFSFLLLFPLACFSQFRWEVGGSLGASNYLGDMGGKELTRRDFIADLKLSQTHIAANIYGRYKIHPNISLRAAFTYGRISGADRLSSNPGRNSRNLNFRNDLFELTLDGQFYFYEVNDIGRAYRYRNDFRAFIFAGIGGLYHNPMGQLNGQGDWIALQPLKTEGVTYSLFQFVIPSGVGFYFTIDKRHRIGWELGWRKTFTDYLDDVSTVYTVGPNPPSMANQTAFVLSNTDPKYNSFGVGGKRGDPTHNDAYIFTTVSYGYVIRGKSTFSRNRYKSYFRKGRYKKRKIRAKF